MWVATQDLPRPSAHPFYAKLNQILDRHDFDAYVERLCQRFYADEVGRPGLPPGRYFRLALIGSLWALVTDHRRLVQCVSHVMRRSIAKSPLAHIGVREMAFTAGC